MKVDTIYQIYFSATGTTKMIVEAVTQGFAADKIVKYDITQGQAVETAFSPKDMVVFGVPVYSGRVPYTVIGALNKFKGNKTPVVAVVVYGNREYDDALLELKNMLENNHFRVISLGAFVAEHSIFPAVANGRPDEQDRIKAKQFGKESCAICEKWDGLAPLSAITVKGNDPYRPIKNIPLKPKGNRHCNRCGACVKACPVQAISMESPGKTDKSRCISCARCIKVCPQNARHFGGILYKVVRRKFVSAYGGVRKEPELFFADI